MGGPQQGVGRAGGRQKAAALIWNVSFESEVLPARTELMLRVDRLLRALPALRSGVPHG